MISCIRLLSELTGRKFSQVRSCYAPPFKLDGPRPANEAHLLAALAAMERDRSVYLTALRAFERKRIRQKMRGQRHPCKTDRETLSAAAKEVGIKSSVQ